MRLYIAEKETVGKAIAEALPGEKKRAKTHIECGENVVAWLQGHIIQLCNPEEYDERYKRWSLNTLLYVPEKWKYKEISGKGYFLQNVRTLLKKAQEVINVGDPDREGQLLVDEVLEYCAWKGPTKRMWLNDNHPDTIRKALGELRENSEYAGLYDAGRARAYSDWLVGLASTRLATIQFDRSGYDLRGVISVGRVQTPTLGLVVRREDEIENFIPKDYWILSAELQMPDGRKIKGKWQQKEGMEYDFLDEENRIVSEKAVKDIAGRIDGKTGEIVRVKKEHKIKKPPLPFNLPKLQIAANQKYKIKDTLTHVQKLYEQGYVSYPRTNIRHLPEVRHDEANTILNMLEVALPSIGDVIKGADPARKSPAWNDAKVKEHYGIIPTKKAPKMDDLSDIEKKVYEMICLRYVLQFLSDHEYEQTSADFTVEEQDFRAIGRTIKVLGWMGWDKGEPTETEAEGDDGRELPAVKNGEQGETKAFSEAKKTTAPKRYTYGTLLEAMNSIYKYVSDPEVKKKLKEVSGIGTPATQQNIIKTLFERGYITEEKDKLFPTGLGKILIKSLEGSKAAMLTTPDLTASWEETMDLISDSQASLKTFLDETIRAVKEITATPFEVKVIPGVEVATKEKCFEEGCAGYLTLRKSKDDRSYFKCLACGKMCSEKDGKPVAPSEKQAVSALKEAPCPSGCGKNARQYEGKYGKYWRCACTKETFADENDKPVIKIRKQQEKAKCPMPRCKGEAVKLYKKADGTPFWKCEKCQNFFNDMNGKPAVKEGKKG